MQLSKCMLYVSLETIFMFHLHQNPLTSTTYLSRSAWIRVLLALKHNNGRITVVYENARDEAVCRAHTNQ